MFDFSNPNSTQRDVAEALIAAYGERLEICIAEINDAHVVVEQLVDGNAIAALNAYRTGLFSAANNLQSAKTELEAKLTEWDNANPPPPIPDNLVLPAPEDVTPTDEPA